jgi:hypothetical protein
VVFLVEMLLDLVLAEVVDHIQTPQALEQIMVEMEVLAEVVLLRILRELQEREAQETRLL